VTMTSPSERVFGDKMVYDLDRAVVIISGGDLKIETAKQVVTAEESLEYWQQELAVVARGNAKVLEEGRTVSADTLTGYMKSDGAGKNALYQVEAQGNVRIQRGDEIVRCNSAVYNLDSGIATLSGGVKISQGGNQLNGDYAEINLNTGVSRLLGNPNGGRVQSLILPGSKPTGPQPTP
jgi:lipopolysaccharide export system protein LptA